MTLEYSTSVQAITSLLHKSNRLDYLLSVHCRRRNKTHVTNLSHTEPKTVRSISIVRCHCDGGQADMITVLLKHPPECVCLFEALWVLACSHSHTHQWGATLCILYTKRPLGIGEDLNTERGHQACCLNNNQQVMITLDIK